MAGGGGVGRGGVGCGGFVGGVWFVCCGWVLGVLLGVVGVVWVLLLAGWVVWLFEVFFGIVVVGVLLVVFGVCVCWVGCCWVVCVCCLWCFWGLCVVCGVCCCLGGWVCLCWCWGWRSCAVWVSCGVAWLFFVLMCVVIRSSWLCLVGSCGC
ncbi:hypothetical protein, partial [Pseudomonas syringae group genomosp. 7]|uniref:hypothetical protein n=1 Tax=Pseudomonas syringae group genomosp. 7 TaxID=251699 RepID=UPI00376F79D2